MEQAATYGARIRDTGRLCRLAALLVWQSSPGLVTAVAALLPPLQLWSARGAIDRAALDLSITGALRFPSPATLDPLARALPLGGWVALATGVFTIQQVIQPCSATFQGMAADRLTGRVTERMIRAANAWPGIARFEDPGFADDLERARSSVSSTGVKLLVVVGQALLHLLTAGALAVTLAGLHPLAPALLVGTTLPQLMLRWEFGERMGKTVYLQTPEARRLRFFRDVMLTAEPAKDVRLYGLGPFFRHLYDGVFSRTMAALDELRRGLGARVTLASALSAGVGALIYVSLVWLVAAGTRTIGELTLYGGAAALLQARLVAVSYYLGFLPQPLSALPSVFRVLDAPPDLPQSPLPIQREPTRREPTRRAPQPAVQGITFDHVAFRYPQSTSAAPKNAAPANAGSTNSGTAGEGDTPTPAAERPTSIPVLSDLSFAIAPGESLALVGHNGAGKTTIVKLLLRLYDPTAGRILLDGVDLREYDLDDLRRQMGVIFQDFGRYALTAGENIGLGQVEALGDRERLERAARRAEAADLIASLPKGLDTRLGREFGTRELSGGEWQKLALARAFMRDCQVLVLDEPTAALDVQTEHDVYTRFHRLTRDRMTLLISHRFSTVRLADHILVLENGRIAERGSHEELVALGGRYATLFEMQAGRYR